MSHAIYLLQVKTKFYLVLLISLFFCVCSERNNLGESEFLVPPPLVLGIQVFQRRYVSRFVYLLKIPNIVCVLVNV